MPERQAAQGAPYRSGSRRYRIPVSRISSRRSVFPAFRAHRNSILKRRSIHVDGEAYYLPHNDKSLDDQPSMRDHFQCDPQQNEDYFKSQVVRVVD